MDKPKGKVTTIYGTIEWRKIQGEGIRWYLFRTLAHNNLADSHEEAKDLIRQGQVKVNGKIIKDEEYTFREEDISQEGEIIVETKEYRLVLTVKD